MRSSPKNTKRLYYLGYLNGILHFKIKISSNTLYIKKKYAGSLPNKEVKILIGPYSEELFMSLLKKYIKKRNDDGLYMWYEPVENLTKSEIYAINANIICLTKRRFQMIF